MLTMAETETFFHYDRNRKTPGKKAVAHPIEVTKVVAIGKS